MQIQNYVILIEQWRKIPKPKTDAQFDVCLLQEIAALSLNAYVHFWDAKHFVQVRLIRDRTCIDQIKLTFPSTAEYE